MRMLRPATPATPEKLRAFEERFGVTLPEAYKAFLAEHNGGVPELDTVDVPGCEASPCVQIQLFHGLDDSRNYNDLAWHIENSEILPAKHVVIANTGGGGSPLPHADRRGRLLGWLPRDASDVPRRADLRGLPRDALSQRGLASVRARVNPQRLQRPCNRVDLSPFRFQGGIFAAMSQPRAARSPAPEIPSDLRAALEGSAAARARFGALPPSHQREHLRWIDEAKRADTRARRIEKTIATLAAEAAATPEKPRARAK